MKQELATVRAEAVSAARAEAAALADDVVAAREQAEAASDLATSAREQAEAAVDTAASAADAVRIDLTDAIEAKDRRTTALEQELAAAKAEITTLRATSDKVLEEAAMSRQQAQAAMQRAQAGDQRIEQINSELTFAMSQLDELKAGLTSAGQAAIIARREAESAKKAAVEGSEKNNERVSEVFREIIGMAARGGVGSGGGSVQRRAELGKLRAQRESSIREIPTREPRHGFDDAPQPMAVLTLDGKFRELNAAFSKLVGYQEHEFVKAVWPSVHDRAVYKQQTEELAHAQDRRDRVGQVPVLLHALAGPDGARRRRADARARRGRRARFHPPHGRRTLTARRVRRPRPSQCRRSTCRVANRHPLSAAPKSAPGPPPNAPPVAVRSAPPPETFSARDAQPPEPAAPSEDPFRVERARPEPEPEPEPAVEGSWFEEDEPEAEPEREPDAMPEDPFPQATQEFQPAWVEEDDDVAWETPEPVVPVSREPAPPPPPRRPRAATRRPVPPRGPRTTLSNPRSNGRRPAGAPRNRFPRRILAVLALALIGGALWLINATFQPFHGDPARARPWSPIPPAPTPARSASCSRPPA